MLEHWMSRARVDKEMNKTAVTVSSGVIVVTVNREDGEIDIEVWIFVVDSSKLVRKVDLWIAQDFELDVTIAEAVLAH